MIANAQSEIQIVDTHETLETLINVDVAASTTQFNRALVIIGVQLAGMKLRRISRIFPSTKSQRCQ